MNNQLMYSSVSKIASMAEAARAMLLGNTFIFVVLRFAEFKECTALVPVCGGVLQLSSGCKFSAV